MKLKQQNTKIISQNIIKNQIIKNINLFNTIKGKVYLIPCFILYNNTILKTIHNLIIFFISLIFSYYHPNHYWIEILYFHSQ